MSLGTIPTFTVARARASQMQQISDALTWITVRKGVRLRRAAAQSINNNTVTAVPWDTEDQDTDGFWIVGSPTIVTIPAGHAGRYLCTLTGTSTGSAGAARKFVNIAPTTAITGVPAAIRGNGGTGESDCGVGGELVLAAGDTITCHFYHNTGSAQNWTGTFSLYRIGE